jgi:hypothetical protein
MGFLGLLGSEDARAAGGRCARPSSAWARRRRDDCAGDPTRAGSGSAKGSGVRGGVHARQATHAGAQGWGRVGGRGGVHGGARLDAMGGGESVARGWPACTRRVHDVVFRATKNAACFPLVTVRALSMATATRPPCARR